MTQTTHGPVSGDARALMLFEANKKSVVLAYLLWWFLGWLGGHRFYTGRYVTAVIALLLWVIGGILAYVAIGFLLLIPAALWWLIDAFLIPGWIRTFNSDLAHRIGAGA